MKKTASSYLQDKLPEDKLSLVNRSFDIIGDIAVCEISNELEEYERLIGEAIMSCNRSIKTVLKKVGNHKGEFRTQDLAYVTGEKKEETIYTENGVRLLIKPGSVYFSSRLSTERRELAESLKADSLVLVMFSGLGPYTFTLLKYQPDVKRIDSIEINPQGHEYGLKNLELNKNLARKTKVYSDKLTELKNNKKYIDDKQLSIEVMNEKLRFFNGDVKQVIQEELNEERYDEIFMPLPKDAELFLESAFVVSKPGTLVHMYDFVHDNEFPQKSQDAVLDSAKKLNKKVKILSTRKVGQYAPGKYRVCCDFEVQE